MNLEGQELAKVQALMAEFIGTFYLVLAISFVVTSAEDIAAFIGIGLTLMVLIFSFGHVSGAHFNPAVSFAVFVSGNMGAVKLGTYWLVQILGGLGGALSASAISGLQAGPQPGAELYNRNLAAFTMETLFTFSLAFTVLMADVHPDNSKKPIFGLAIAWVVLAGAGTVGAISGAVFNPAVGIGLQFTNSLFNNGDMHTIWIYILAPLLGGALAGGAYRLLLSDRFHQNAKVALVEFLGTMFLTICAGLASLPIAVGAILMSWIYAGGWISGGKYNPAVSLGIMIRFRWTIDKFGILCLEVVSQLLGAIVGAYIARGCAGMIGYPHPTGEHGEWGSFFFEFLWTALLVTVVLHVATPTSASDTEAGSKWFDGFSIGMTVAAGGFAGQVNAQGPGGVFNPAVGTALGLVAATMGDGTDSDGSGRYIWLYWLGPFLGAVLGTGIFKALHAHVDPRQYSVQYSELGSDGEGEAEGP